LKTANTAES